MPGFAAIAPSFTQTEKNLANLPEPVLLRLPADVLFDFDSAQLKPEASGLLGQAVGLITKYPQADVHIDGYTDSYGKADYNQTLSQQRAEAVQAWLQQHISQSAYNSQVAGPRQLELHRPGHGQHRPAAAEPPGGDPDPGHEALAGPLISPRGLILLGILELAGDAGGGCKIALTPRAPLAGCPTRNL